jgi:hypothetical protein
MQESHDVEQWMRLPMDPIGRQWHKNVEKNAVFRRLVEVSGRRWTMKW